jgi:hypothetical protein
MDGCISVCTVAKSSIHCLSHPIPSVEFSPTNSPEDEGKLFVHSNPLEQVYILYMSVTKLSLAERLILLHLLGAKDGNVVVVRSHKNVIMCKIMARPHGPPAAMAQMMKTTMSLAIRCHRSMSQSLDWMGWMRALASLHSTIYSSSQHLQQQHTIRST